MQKNSPIDPKLSDLRTFSRRRREKISIQDKTLNLIISATFSSGSRTQYTGLWLSRWLVRNFLKFVEMLYWRLASDKRMLYWRLASAKSMLYWRLVSAKRMLYWRLGSDNYYEGRSFFCIFKGEGCHKKIYDLYFCDQWAIIYDISKVFP